MSCYGNAIVPQNAAAFEGETQFLGFLPFEEKSTNKTLAAFLKYVKQVGGTPDQFSVYAWMATLAFADAVNATVQGERDQRDHPSEPDHRHQDAHHLRRRRHGGHPLVQGRARPRTAS